MIGELEHFTTSIRKLGETVVFFFKKISVFIDLFESLSYTRKQCSVDLGKRIQVKSPGFQYWLSLLPVDGGLVYTVSPLIKSKFPPLSTK